MKTFNKDVSDCCWAELFPNWYNDAIFRCSACGNPCKTIKLTEKMVNQAKQLEELCRQKGYTKED